VQEFALCDATLIGIRWSTDGRDLSLDLRLGDGREAMLSCRWAAGVRIQIHADSRELGGPLSSECRWERAGGGWRMWMDFAGRGAVELDCQGAVLVYDAG